MMIVMLEAETPRRRAGIMVGSWPLGLPPDGSFYLDLARQVERLGFDLLFTGDHIFMYSPNAEAMSVMAAWAGVTERLCLGTAVLLLALRDPALAAKQLATIDYLSGGRLVVGVGVGGEIEQEWQAMEVSTKDRGARTDEYLELMRALWSGQVVDSRGAFRSVQGVAGSPRPVQREGPPIWVGGRSEAALRRAARHDGWCAYSLSPRRIREGLERIAGHGDGLADSFRTSYVLFTYVDDNADRAVEMAGRVLGKRYRQNFDRFLDAFCAVGDAAHVQARVEEYHAAGVQDVILCPQAPAEEYPEQVERLAEALGVRPS
jgi:probable F420-dependent oxidoreductase